MIAAAWTVLKVALALLAMMTVVLAWRLWVDRDDLGAAFAVAYLVVIVVVILSALVLIADWML